MQNDIVNATIDGHSIVIVGEFTPSTFHPSWFGMNNLIMQSEVEAANVIIVHKDITVFSTDWFAFEASKARIIIKTDQQAYFENLRDIAFGIYRLLPHAIVKALGINFDVYKTMSDEKYSDFFNTLSPIYFWSNFLEQPYLERYVIIDKLNSNVDGNILKMEISPSIRKNYEIHVEFNTHFQIAKSEDEICYGEEVANIISSQWLTAYDRVKNITQKF